MSRRKRLIGDVCIVRRGTTITQTLARPGNIPVVAGGLTPTYFHDTHNRDGNVITISGSGANAGYVNFWKQPIFASDCSTVTTNNSEVDINFIFYFLRSQQSYINSTLRSGAAQPHVYAKDIAKLEIMLPPLADQSRIASILDQAETLRTQRRTALAQLDSLTQSLFLDMFGDPSSETRRWQKVELASVAELITGYPFKSEEYLKSHDGIKLCRGVNVLPDRLDWRDTAYWPNAQISELEAFRLVSGDIVMAMDRPWISEGFKLAQIAPEDEPMLLVQRVARIRARDSATNAFLYGVLSHIAFTRHCKPTETTIPHISPKDIRSYKFPLPPLALQQTFATRIQTIESLKTTHRTALTELDALFASLQQRAFAGEL